MSGGRGDAREAGRWRAVDAERGTVLAARVRPAASFWLRLRGLLGRRLREREGLLLTPCAAIHTCFLRHPIDAVFLDGEGRVLWAGTVAPWRVRAVAGARQVLELPAGTVARSRLRAGGRLRVEPAGPGEGRAGRVPLKGAVRGTEDRM